MTIFVTNIQDQNALMNGGETYDIFGNNISIGSIETIIKECRGLNKYWNCLEKSIIARDYLEFGTVVIGSLMVYNKDRTATYGYLFNPPFEFHAWLVFNDGCILDVALPGVIQKGLETKDEIGYILEDYRPFITNGKPASFTEYKWYARYE